MSCTLHDVHDPQSARASITTSHFVAISWRRSIGAGFVNVGLAKRSTSNPRPRNTSSTRSRNTLPRALEMSSRPTVLPLRVPDPLGCTLGDALRAAHDVLARHQRQLVQPLAQLRLRPSRLREHAPVLGPDDQDGIERHRQLRVLHGEQAGGVRARQRIGFATQLVDDAARSLAREQRDGARSRVEAALDVQRLPRRTLLVLREAERQLPRVALRGAIDAAGATAADVADHELQRAPDRAVGAVALPEHVHSRVHPDARPHGTVHDHHRPDRHRRGQQTVDVELVGARRLDAGDDDGEVLGLAPREHGVDRDLLHRALDQVGWDDGDDVAGRAGRALEHAQHARLGRRDERQAVAPSPLEHRLDLVLERAHLHAPRREPVPFEAHPQLVDHRRVDGEGTASRAHVGQLLPEPVDAGARRPLRAAPAHRAVALDTALDAQQRGHGLDPVVVRHREVLVEHDLADAARERRVVLRVDGELHVGVRVELREHGFDHPARRAVALHDRHDPVRQQRPVPHGRQSCRRKEMMCSFTTSGFSRCR